MLARSSLLLACLGACAVDPSAAYDNSAAAVEVTADIKDRLAAIPGVSVIELPSPAPGYRHFNLAVVQPVDHRHPEGASFTQRVNLIHRDETRPMVFGTNGYGINPAVPSYGLLARSLDGNRLTVEHRYFGPSTPEPADGRFLNIDQAAGDHHRIAEALRPIYTGAWISTGASKGGMTATYHARRYPDDIEGVVADVAPMSFGTRDVRYSLFLHQVGDQACRDKMHAFQREVLSRRATLAPLIDELLASRGDGFSKLPGGADQGIDMAMGDIQFVLWQYGEAADCETIPAPGAPDDELVGYLDGWGVIYGDRDIATYGPYYYQAVTQLGMPRVPTAHMRDLLHYDPNDWTDFASDYDPLPLFDHFAMLDMALWSVFQSERILYVYGENDPWTAGAYPIFPDGRRDVHKFTVAAGNHGASFWRLAPADQAKFLERLAAWTGVTPIPPPPTLMMKSATSWMDDEPEPRGRRL